MISLFSKYAKVITLALALLIAAPVAISAAETSTGPASLAQNSNRAFNGGGAPVRRRVRRKVRRKVRKHRHNHAVLVHLTR